MIEIGILVVELWSFKEQHGDEPDIFEKFLKEPTQLKGHNLDSASMVSGPSLSGRMARLYFHGEIGAPSMMSSKWLSTFYPYQQPQQRWRG
jgi:hypothetical protein